MKKTPLREEIKTKIQNIEIKLSELDAQRYDRRILLLKMFKGVYQRQLEKINEDSLLQENLNQP